MYCSRVSERNPSKLTEQQLLVLRMAQVNGPNRLRIALALVNVDQGDLVKATGLHRARVSRIMNGRVPDIGLTTAQKFAEYFGCTVEDLFPHGVAA